MKNVASFTRPFADQGDDVIFQAKQSINNLNGLIGDLRQLSGKANTLLTQSTTVKALSLV
ncbi:MAG: hypothetical protein U0930_14555 [Pirellulales bacterium]